jgi:hypothetical protein
MLAPLRHYYCCLLAALVHVVPLQCSAVVQFINCYHSRRVNERQYHITPFWALGALSFLLLPLAYDNNKTAAFGVLVISVIGIMGAEGIAISYYLALMGGEKVSCRLMDNLHVNVCLLKDELHQ